MAQLPIQVGTRLRHTGKYQRSLGQLNFVNRDASIVVSIIKNGSVVLLVSHNGESTNQSYPSGMINDEQFEIVEE